MEMGTSRRRRRRRLSLKTEKELEEEVEVEGKRARTDCTDLTSPWASWFWLCASEKIIRYRLECSGYIM
jgi:hypothetical protein